MAQTMYLKCRRPGFDPWVGKIAWRREWLLTHDLQIFSLSLWLVFSSSLLLFSVTQLCLTLCDPMDYSTPGLLVHHHLPEFTQTAVHRVGDDPTISSSVISSSWFQSFPASRSFQISQFFTSGGQSIGVSASASVLPMNIQD